MMTKHLLQKYSLFISCIVLLLSACQEYGADQTGKPEENYSISALISAIKTGNSSLATSIIDSNKLDINTKDEQNYYPIHYAVLYGLNDIVDSLIKHNATIDIPAPFNLTALHYAAFMGNEVIAKQLIDAGATVNAKDLDQNTPLHFAYTLSHDKVIKLLEDNKAKKSKNKNSDKPSKPTNKVTELTAIIFYTDDVALAEAMLSLKKIDINTPIEQGNLPASLVIGLGRKKLTEFLKNKGADFSKVDIFATINTERTGEEFSEYLKLTKADVNKKDNNGLSLLQRAAGIGNIAILNILITNGANVSQTIDQYGWTTVLDEYAGKAAWQYVENPHYFEVLKILLSNGAKPGKYPTLNKLLSTIVEYVKGNDHKGDTHVEPHRPTVLLREVFELAEKAGASRFEYISEDDRKTIVNKILRQ